MQLIWNKEVWGEAWDRFCDDAEFFAKGKIGRYQIKKGGAIRKKYYPMNVSLLLYIALA